jgi:hypothetical protein
MSSSTVDAQLATAINVSLDDANISFELADGRVVSAPIAWYPRLMHGAPAERNEWRLIAGGRGIHWPALEEDISVDNLLNGQPSGESQSSLKKWLEQRAK